ncbi:MAG: Fic family protein [Rhodocyclales bacterium]|nr:Fic family protein [Rhodocyclales bacterium]
MDINPQQIPRIDYPAPDPEKPYVYPGTQILINHFQIRSMDVLQRVVDTVAGLRGEQLKTDPVPGEYDLKHLCAVHRALFQDIFAWAGQVRTVDIEKQRQDFVLSADIPGRFQFMHEELKAENFLRGLDPEEFAGRLAHYWYSIYSVHAFRDGNSRAMRYFFDGLAAAAGYKLDFAAIDRTALLEACRHRFFRNDNGPLRDHLRQIISSC